MSVVYVTAVYCIYNDNTYFDKVWERLDILAKFFPLYVFCDENDKERVSALPNVTPIYRKFTDLDTYMTINNTHQMSPSRNPIKDTKEYMILMNAKTEFIKCVKDITHNNPTTHYVWLDAGITKIFKNPEASLFTLKQLLTKPMRTNTIFIPGCWPKFTYYDIFARDFVINPKVDKAFYLQRLTEAINWRFCGGFVVIPTHLVEPFANAVKQEIIRVRETYGTAIWEVNIWTALEDTLPIQWERGDHNEEIFTSLPNDFS